VGVWSGLDELAAIRQVDRRFEPSMPADRRAAKLRGWHRAVERAKGWARED
jgi:glycerol kinase